MTAMTEILSGNINFSDMSLHCCSSILSSIQRIELSHPPTPPNPFFCAFTPSPAKKVKVLEVFHNFHIFRYHLRHHLLTVTVTITTLRKGLLTWQLCWRTWERSNWNQWKGKLPFRVIFKMWISEAQTQFGTFWKKHWLIIIMNGEPKETFIKTWLA